MDLQLKNRIAFVAGASQGLGYATALQLSREGAQVAICSRDEANINAARDAIYAETGNPVLAVRADVRDPDDIECLLDNILEEYGGLDILVTNAGGPPLLPFEELSDAQWQEAINLTIFSALRLIRSSLPHLRLSTVPAVLTITSITVKQPIINLVLSNSLRMAVIGLTKTLSLELGGDSIRFNSILPGWTATERIHDLLEARALVNGTTFEEEMIKQVEQSPLQRMGTPQEFANVAAFLCSPAASYINGTMLAVDGGEYKGTF